MLIGVIGLGNIASKAYLPVLGCKEGVDLALCSRSEETVHRVQSQYRIPKATTHLEDLVRMGITAAFVLSPNDTHALIGRALLEKGVDVFFEKPATLNSRETQELAELADRGGRVMMVGLTGATLPSTSKRYSPGKAGLSGWRSFKNTVQMRPTHILLTNSWMILSTRSICCATFAGKVKSSARSPIMLPTSCWERPAQ